MIKGSDAWRAKGVNMSGLRYPSKDVEDTPPAAFSWMTEILPHVGYDDMYRRFDFNQPWRAEANLPNLVSVVPTFLTPTQKMTRWQSPYTFIPNGSGLTHFVGISGIEDQRNVVAGALPRADARAGVFGYAEVVRLDQVTDGTSQTIMILESARMPGPWVIGGGATVRGVRDNPFDELTGFGSPGNATPGAQAIFVDGSVRYLSSNMDLSVLRALSTIHGNEKIDLNALPQVLQVQATGQATGAQ